MKNKNNMNKNKTMADNKEENIKQQ